MHELLHNIHLPDAEVYYAPQLFTESESNCYFEKLQQEVSWKQEQIKLFGKEITIPRLTAWYGDKAYTYSGLKNAPQPLFPILSDIKDKVQQIAGANYNSVLLNLYRSGYDSMGWHSDDEPELDLTQGIASVSFGAERKFGFRYRHGKLHKNTYLTLQHGSLMLMHGNTQQNWQHALPKTAKPVGPRVNLTFRKIAG
jgi:alkylated DNA repair dioxygenase AlkB